MRSRSSDGRSKKRKRCLGSGDAALDGMAEETTEEATLVVADAATTGRFLRSMVVVVAVMVVVLPAPVFLLRAMAEVRNEQVCGDDEE